MLTNVRHRVLQSGPLLNTTLAAILAYERNAPAPARLAARVAAMRASVMEGRAPTFAGVTPTLDGAAGVGNRGLREVRCVDGRW